MKTDSSAICPYTGLRSFTEEESIYFKGRDQQIDQITELLEQNKFLMVTGASGEGKSSVIYAGLIPNARAGFFKAQFTNWIVADFRPERSPIKNMAASLSAKFEMQQSTIETELRRGYSSMIDLYLNSEFYVDENSEAWKQLDQNEKTRKKRKAANLIILIDQFEEFFTNPENFYNDAPSQDSQIVINLALETARIALKRQLPVYVICTMRSDYIGQCAAFRGLPEYIGFSQFFVPRLKRKDLKQVIEEPAILSGNSISQRLIERLVFDVAEGVDQLPILQHALSRIWDAARNGSEEMDLIHYAQVGGMPAEELPDEDRKRLEQWFEALPTFQKTYYSETGLNKVIEIHANILYEGAWDNFNKNHSETLIEKREVKRIIALAFASLTKIDSSRAVRNRVSLNEITGIVNATNLSVEIVGNVLETFREEGNSFIRPFKTASSPPLGPEVVLDITHESLIRNWSKLNDWANREFDYYSIYLDFKKQLDRWKASGRSSGFLLPIGPLTYFENWYAKCNPNPYWIKRYAETQTNEAEALRNAERILEDTRGFLKQSARKVTVSRAFMKYGTQQIVSILAIIVMLSLSGFYWYDAERKRNANIIGRVRKEAQTLLSSKEIDDVTKAEYLVIEERYKGGFMLPYLRKMDDKSSLTQSVKIYQLLLQFDKHFKNPIKDSLLTHIGFLLESGTSGSELENTLAQSNKMISYLAYYNYYNPDKNVEQTLAQFSDMGYVITLKFLQDKNLFKPAVPIELNQATQHWLTFGRDKVTPEKIKALINLISPFATDSANAFETYYPKGSFEGNGLSRNDFNGGYHTVASLYAAVGDANNVIRCFEKINAQSVNYFNTANAYNNYQNVLGYLYQYEQRHLVPKVLEWIERNTSNTATTTLRNCIFRVGYITRLFFFEQRGIFDFEGIRSQLNLCFGERKIFYDLIEDYENKIKVIKNADERNFLLAMNYKRNAIFEHKYFYDRNLPIDKQALYAQFDKAMLHFNQIKEAYSDSAITIPLNYFLGGVRNPTFKRRQLFVYPDYLYGSLTSTYHSDLFFNYIKEKNQFSNLYKTQSDVDMVQYWVAKAFEVYPEAYSRTYRNDYPLSDVTLENVLGFANSNNAAREFDKNLIAIVLANRNFARNDLGKALMYFKMFQQEHISSTANRYEYLEKTFFYNQLKDLSVNLALNGMEKEAVDLAEKFDYDYNKIYSYIAMADGLFKADFNPNAFIFLDSALSKMKKIDYNTSRLDSRDHVIWLLSKIGGRDLNGRASAILTELQMNDKPYFVLVTIYGIAQEGNYYRALTTIPPSFTEQQELVARCRILHNECRNRDKKSGNVLWDAMDDYLVDNDWNYIFYRRV